MSACLQSFDFVKTHKSGCKLDTVHFTSMATGHNRFSVIEELSSHAFLQDCSTSIAEMGYPELPDISDNPLLSYMCVCVCMYVCVCVCLCVCKTQSSCNPSHLIDRGTTALPPVSSPSNILPPSTHCALVPARKDFAARVKMKKKLTSLILNRISCGMPEYQIWP